MKTTSSEPGENMLCTQIVFCFDIQNNLCTQHVLPMFWGCSFHIELVNQWTIFVILWVNWSKSKCFWQRFTCTGEALEISDDYTKRKHVFRIKTNRSEVLYQADSEVAFQQWLTSLEAIVGPQRISRNARKLTSASTALASNTRNRSPTGHSPATKSRKPSSGKISCKVEKI